MAVGGSGGGGRRMVGFVLLGFVVVALVLGGLQLRAGRYGFIAGFLRDQLRGTGTELARQDDPPTYDAIAATAPDGFSPISIVGPQPATGDVLTVGVAPPDGAARMQVSSSPSFVGASWQDVAAEVDVPVFSTGYQTVFARFELADGSLSQTWTGGGEVDPTYDAATSSAGEGGRHRPSWVRPFSSTELVVRIEAGRMLRGSLEAYDLDDPADGDRIVQGRDLKLVNRDGEGYGLQVSERTDVIRRADRLIGRPLDVEAATGGTWMVTSPDDPGYYAEVAPADLQLLSWPAGGGTDGDNEPVWELTHDVVLSLPVPLTVGVRYRIEPAGSIEPIEFVYDPAVIQSPAVRVTQVGFDPGDQPKVAYLSGWFDGIGESALEAAAASEATFTVVDAESGAVLFNGSGSAADTGAAELSGSPVVELDFSTLTEPGRYRVCVEAVGCSYPFAIVEGLWSDLADTVARATYVQRSGVEVGPPYTPFVRPRPYQPADGLVVTGTDYTLLQARLDPMDQAFAALPAKANGERFDQAWGGHFDAGDWDRRIYHLWYARNAALLVSEFPDLYGSHDLNIPESGDAVPDLLDEALWSLDFYRRLQRPDGAVSGGVEASEHPPQNTASWVDDLAVYAYRPDAYSTYIYAGAAAEVSAALRPYDPARADGYLASAQAAMEWAETTGREELATLAFATEEGGAGVDELVADQRNVATAALLLATGDQRWHDLFVETATYLGSDGPDMSCHQHTRCDAAWLYLRADPSVTDAAIRETLTDRFRRTADNIIAFAQTNGYGWTTENPGVPLIWGLGSGGTPHDAGLLRAYLLTGEPRYREAALRSALVALGANPQNRSMITGVGQEPVRHAQINDVKHGGLPLWAGTPVYGHHDLSWSTDLDWVTDGVLTPAGAKPDPRSLPYMWQWFDVSNVAVFNEFTVHQSHADTLFTFATLAATTTRD